MLKQIESTEARFIYLLPDVSKVSVIESERQIRIV